ncbi:WbqC family protein [Marinifilum sp. D714]|uniref:WbqC family protein n=1 Tax=Marinifilum sp. D714 TaxID=2937523 RepID=UPI0027C9359D|nr:WbqC family protein [Marinifilum sp. D714]MDQ2178496.1 WbqC family protein [Marinifilum sp. D714]
MRPSSYQRLEKQVRNCEFPIPGSVAIIQPYVFPYLGYFQLLYSVENVVFYDDVSYIKRGWINRNKILLNGKEFMFTIPLQKASQNKLINEIRLVEKQLFIQKFRQQLEAAYKKAPYYAEVKDVIESVFVDEYSSIGDLAIASILAIFRYINLDLNWVKSSEEFCQTKGQAKADRLICISKMLECDTYINPVGGKSLYHKDYFAKHGIELGFIESGIVNYKQFENDFVPYLSIIDVLMFNDKSSVIELLNNFDIG